MGIEIERKFLVSGPAWGTQAGVPYVQGYLNRDKARTVRVRVAGDQAYLTIKGKSEGATRTEFEYPIPMDDARALLALCDGPLIEKTRYRVPHAGFTWDVDVFEGANSGLVVAEIELESETQHFERPDWLGEEVTHDARYFNSNLASHPVSTW
jgi:CYTH domain-containing protein